VNSRVPITILEAKPKQEATHAGVRQDKYPPGRIGVFSAQPQSADIVQESAKNTSLPPIPPADNRPKHHGSETRQTAQIAGRAPFTTKARILAIAKAQGLTESKVVVNLVHKALQIDGDVQYGAMLRPVIQDQIHKDIQAYSNRTTNIGLQAYYAAEQARILCIHILRFLTDLVNSADDDPINSPDELPLIIKVAQEEAWKNMTNLNRDKTDALAKEEDYEEW
jgi:hypothetical protein